MTSKTVADDANFHMPTDGDDAPASPIVVLTCRTKIVHSRFDSITSYRAEGTGLLIIPFLAAHLLSDRLLRDDGFARICYIRYCLNN